MATVETDKKSAGPSQATDLTELCFSIEPSGLDNFRNIEKEEPEVAAGFLTSFTYNKESNELRFSFHGNNLSDKNKRDNGSISCKLSAPAGLSKDHLREIETILDRSKKTDQNDPHSFASPQEQINEILKIVGQIQGDPAIQDLSGLKLENLRLEAFKGGHYIMDRTQFNNVELENCCLRGASIEKSTWQNVQAKGCDFGGAILTGTKIDSQSSFERIRFDDASLSELDYNGSFNQVITLGSELPNPVKDKLRTLLDRLDAATDDGKEELRSEILSNYKGMTFSAKSDLSGVIALLKKHGLVRQLDSNEITRNKGWSALKEQLKEDGLRTEGSTTSLTVHLPGHNKLVFNQADNDSISLNSEQSTIELDNCDLTTVPLSRLAKIIMEKARLPKPKQEPVVVADIKSPQQNLEKDTAPVQQQAPPFKELEEPILSWELLIGDQVDEKLVNSELVYGYLESEPEELPFKKAAETSSEVLVTTEQDQVTEENGQTKTAQALSSMEEQIGESDNLTANTEIESTKAHPDEEITKIITQQQEILDGLRFLTAEVEEKIQIGGMDNGELESRKTYLKECLQNAKEENYTILQCEQYAQGIRDDSQFASTLSSNATQITDEIRKLEKVINTRLRSTNQEKKRRGSHRRQHRKAARS